MKETANAYASIMETNVTIQRKSFTNSAPSNQNNNNMVVIDDFLPRNFNARML